MQTESFLHVNKVQLRNASQTSSTSTVHRVFLSDQDSRMDTKRPCLRSSSRVKDADGAASSERQSQILLILECSDISKLIKQHHTNRTCHR